MSSKSHLIVVLATIALLVGVGWFLSNAAKQLDEHALDGYLVYDAASFAAEFYKDFDAWPSSWEDLQRYRQRLSPHGYSFDDIQQRVVIDFSPDTPDHYMRAIRDGEEPIAAVDARYWPARVIGTNEGGKALLIRFFRGEVSSALSASSAVTP